MRWGLAILVLVAAGGILLPHVLPDYRAQVFPPLSSPSLAHPFGTDWAGRDLLARWRRGARISLTIALTTRLAATVGAAVGLVAGYVGGAVDAVLMRSVDAALAIPRVFVPMLVLLCSTGSRSRCSFSSSGITGWFSTSRLVRGEVLRLKEEPFVRAAEALGRRPGGLSSVTCCPTAPARSSSPRPSVARRDPARGRTLVSRARRPAPDALLGRHDPRRAIVIDRALAQPLSRPRHRGHGPVGQPGGRSAARSPDPVPPTHESLLEVERSGGLLPWARGDGPSRRRGELLPRTAARRSPWSASRAAARASPRWPCCGWCRRRARSPTAASSGSTASRSPALDPSRCAACGAGGSGWCSRTR